MPTFIRENCFKLPTRPTSAVIGDLPEDWLRRLINQLVEETRRDRVYDYYDAQIGTSSTYAHKTRLIEILTSVYHLVVNTETAVSRKEQILFSLPKEDGELHCTPGFHNRLEQIYLLIISPSPTSLDELTAQLRHDIVDKTARTQSGDIHTINDYFREARMYGYGVLEINAHDPHRGYINRDDMQRELGIAFTSDYTFFKIVHYGINRIKGELEKFGYTGARTTDRAYEGETITSVMAYLRLFFKDIAAEHIFLMDESYSFTLDINWAFITKCFIEELIKAKYFTLSPAELAAIETFRIILSSDPTNLVAPETAIKLVEGFALLHYPRPTPYHHIRNLVDLIATRLPAAYKKTLINELIEKLSLSTADVALLLEQYSQEQRSDIIAYIDPHALTGPVDLRTLLTDIQNNSDEYQQIYFELLVKKQHRLLHSAADLIDICEVIINQDQMSKLLAQLISTDIVFKRLTKDELNYFLTHGTEKQKALIATLVKQPQIRKKIFPSPKELTGKLNYYTLDSLFKRESPARHLIYLDLLDQETIKDIYNASLSSFVALEWVLNALGKKTEATTKFIKLYGLDNCLLHCYGGCDLTGVIQLASYLSEELQLELSKKLTSKKHPLSVYNLSNLNKMDTEETRREGLYFLRKDLPRILRRPEDLSYFLSHAANHKRTYDDSTLKEIIKIKKIELQNSYTTCLIIGIVGTGICAAAYWLPVLGLIVVNPITLSLALVGCLGSIIIPLTVIDHCWRDQKLIKDITTYEEKVIAKHAPPKI